MATTRKKTTATQETKLTAVEARQKVEELQDKLDKFEDTAFCIMCRKHKDRKNKFYLNTDPKCGGESCTSICRECARRIALRVDKNGDEHTPTKESVIEALKYLNKPFLNTVWNASIQESENLIAGKIKHNVWVSYIKNIQMIQYVGLTYFDSDFFKEKIIYEDEKTEEDIKNIDVGTYNQFIKDRSDVIRLIHYDPFDKESIEDQPFLYSQLLGLLDSSEDANDDMLRISSCITIVRSFLQQSKIDDAIAKIMSDYKNMSNNAGAIKSLQDSRSKITSVISTLAEQSCISLKHNKNAKKGENTWTGKIKKIKELNLREGEVNGFDIWTCKGMQQVMEMSDASIMKQLKLDESEWSDIVAEQRVMVRKLQEDCKHYQEISRILLRENIDLKDILKENNLLNENHLVDLDELYAYFASDWEVSENESESGENIQSDSVSS